MDYCDYDEKVSEKFFKFISNLIKVKDKITIGFYDDTISIYCDLNRNNNNLQTEKNFEIRIDEIGFKMRRNYGTYLGFNDPNFLEKIKPAIIERNKIISKEKIIETINDLMMELNLNRENNLEEILS